MRSGLGITRYGQLTWDGVPFDHCPQPFDDDCRPGACNCDGIYDHWRTWGACNRVPSHRPDQICHGGECAGWADDGQYKHDDLLAAMILMPVIVIVWVIVGVSIGALH